MKHPMKALKPLFSILLIPTLFLGLFSCRAPSVEHGSVLTITGNIELKSEDSAKGKLCMNYQTIESSEGERDKVKNHTSCFDAKVVDGKIRVQRTLSFRSYYSKIKISSISGIKFTTRTKMDDKNYDLQNIYKAEVTDFSNPNKDLNVSLKFSFDSTMYEAKLNAIIDGCAIVCQANKTNCIRWRVDPLSAAACARTHRSCFNESACMKEVAQNQGTYR
jgi:hypothetical protein